MSGDPRAQAMPQETAPITVPPCDSGPPEIQKIDDIEQNTISNKFFLHTAISHAHSDVNWRRSADCAVEYS